MKYFLLFLCASFQLISCQTTGKKQIDHRNELIDRFKPYLHGNWVPAEYMADIEKTKSPLLSSDKVGYVSELIIDSSDIVEDTLRVRAAYGNHEGGDFLIYFMKGQAPNSLVTNLASFEKQGGSHELGYVVSDNKVSLVLYRYDKNKKLVEKTAYIKVPIRTNDLTDGFQYLVNKNLVSGSYFLNDSTGTTTKVVLTDEGKVSGFKSFKTFYVLTDFVAGDENDVDQILFENGTPDQQAYGFKIVADTINLFEAPKDEFDTTFKPGPAAYKFVRQH